MNLKQRFIQAAVGFIIGNFLLSLIMIGVYSVTLNQSSKESISFDEAIHRIKSKETEPIDLTITDMRQVSPSPLDRLFQILFILFFISPPIIVVLLLIIIKKMKSNDSMK